MSKEPKKPKQEHPEYCPQQNLDIILTPLKGRKVAISDYARCSHCNRRLKILSYDCERDSHNMPVTDVAKHRAQIGSCLHFYIPRHKNKKNK